MAKGSAVGSNWAALRKKLSGPSDDEPKAAKKKKKKSSSSSAASHRRQQPPNRATEQEQLHIHRPKSDAKREKKQKKRDAADALTGKTPKKHRTTPPSCSAVVSSSSSRPPVSQRPPVFPYESNLAVLLPSSPEYAPCLRHSYHGFVHDPSAAFPDALHAAAEEALEEMTQQGLFHYDVVSAGKAVSSTFCERTLLGDQGMTYHYQRLRIFAYPWEDENTDTGSPFRAMRRLNDAMKKRTRKLVAEMDGAKYRGSAEYNITLINKMDAPERCAVPLRDEAIYGMGPTSVSWHADSSLEDWSSIAVWQTTSNPPDATDWHVAVRVAHDEETPALRIPLKTRDTYYMLNDFNHHHHHAVLAGNSKRYSSTHRVAVAAKDTWGYIRGRCQEALEVVREAGGEGVVNSDAIRKIGEVHIEVELQWLRMFWIQGRRHAASHGAFWVPCMEKLERWWRKMEESLAATIKVLLGSTSAAKERGDVEARSYSMAAYVLEELAKGRSELKKRCKSQPYRALPPDCRPITDRPAPLRTEELWQEIKALKAKNQEFQAATRNR